MTLESSFISVRVLSFFYVLFLTNFALDHICLYLKVPYHIEGGQPSYLIISGLVFTPLSEPLIEYVCLDSPLENELLIFNGCKHVLMLIYFCLCVDREECEDTIGVSSG